MSVELVEKAILGDVGHTQHITLAVLADGRGHGLKVNPYTKYILKHLLNPYPYHLHTKIPIKPIPIPSTY
jgi:hypothetical protein